MNHDIIYTQAVTHAGIFHADDVFATAFIRMLWPDIKVRRVNAVPEGFGGLVYDIGLGEFDHHQADKEYRENGIPYAAFGLLWRRFASYLMPQEDADVLDRMFVQKIDSQDNGGPRNEISGAIKDFVPSWDEEKSMDAAFWDAVDWAAVILERKIRRISSERKAAETVKSMVVPDDHILVLETYLPWQQSVVGTQLRYVVYPSQRGGYNAQAVPRDPEPEEEKQSARPVKKPFPKEWAAKTPEELEKLSGIKGLTFCHAGRFLISAQTKGAAIAAARRADAARDDGKQTQKTTS